MLREIIEIEEDLCVGCGNCVPNCHQGALQIIDGKARLISDLMCEGIGACVGHCPTGAMTIEKREAEPYDERKVMKKLMSQGSKVVQAHIDHLKEHHQDQYLAEALDYLDENGFKLPEETMDKEVKENAFMELMAPREENTPHHGSGCPGSAARTIKRGAGRVLAPKSEENNSELSQWPIQLHLLMPQAPYLQGADLVLAADCTAFAVGDFHNRFLAGKKLAIACPKLDSNQAIYLEKLMIMVDQGGLNTLSVIVMEVPCCQSLVSLAQEALKHSSRKIPLKKITISIEGEVKGEEWVNL